MGIREFIFGTEKKESRTTQAIVMETLGKPIWTPRDYANFAREGYAKNVYVYACVRTISMAIAGIPWLVYQKLPNGELQEVPEHPLAQLLQKPNPYQGGSSFFENIAGYLMLAGNAYIEAVIPSSGRPKELYVLRPDRMQVVPGDGSNLIGGYIYTVNGQQVQFTTDQILHLKLFNPINDWYGMSPIEAAAYSIDENNEFRSWNMALLQNAGRPAGALKTSDHLTEEEFERLKNIINEQYSGYKNAGRPLILEGGLEWQEIGLTPEEIHWADGLKLTAREIAIAFGVPPELIGDSENKTYSNWQESRRAFYEETVLPLMDWLQSELNNWLAVKFGTDIVVKYDQDEIEALQENRSEVWNRAIAAVRAGILTPNEARELLGYDPVPGANSLLTSMNTIPLATMPVEKGDDENGK